MNFAIVYEKENNFIPKPTGKNQNPIETLWMELRAYIKFYDFFFCFHFMLFDFSTPSAPEYPKLLAASPFAAFNTYHPANTRNMIDNASRV